MEITSGIHQIKIPIPDNPLEYINCYLVKGIDSWFMIDSGWYTEKAFDILLENLTDRKISLNDISTIIITHVHPDHFGLAGRIKQKNPQTKILMHQWEASLIEPRFLKSSDLKKRMIHMLKSHGVPPVDSTALETAYLPSISSFKVAFPDQLLYGGEIISTGIYDLEVIWTPGHSPGHICLLEPVNKLLFSGDHVLDSITPNISFTVLSGDNPLGSYLYALNKIRNHPVAQVLPGHGSIMTDLPGRIDRIFEHHLNRKTEILNTIEKEPHNAWEISSRITWDTTADWKDFSPIYMHSAVSETVAHLELLRCEGKVDRIYKQSSITYIKKSDLA
jgi:glyoxylase-like metal-dependent hydrolase (beta-lactamase superfamily II)